MKWNKLVTLFFCLFGISSISAARYLNFDLNLIGTTNNQNPDGNLLHHKIRKIRSSVFTETTILSEEIKPKPNSMKWEFHTRRRRQEEGTTTIDDSMSTTALDASTEISMYENEIEPPESPTTPVTPDEATTTPVTPDETTTTPVTPDETTTTQATHDETTTTIPATLIPGSTVPTDSQITTVETASATTNYERHIPKDPGVNLDNFHVHVFKSFVGMLEGIGKVYDTVHRAINKAWNSVKSFFSKIGSWFSSSKPTPIPPTLAPTTPVPTTPAPTISAPTTHIPSTMPS